MAEQNLGNAIELLRTENAKQSADQVQSTDQINKNIEKFLKGLAAMAGDKEEKRRDEKKGKKDKPDGVFGNLQKSDMNIGLGIGMLLAGISGAVLGFVNGFVSAFTKPLMTALKTFTLSMKKSAIGKFLGNFAQNVTKQVKLFFRPLVNTLKNIRIAFSEGLKGNVKVVRGAMGRMLNPIKGFIGIFGRIGNFLSPLAKDISKRWKVISRVLSGLGKTIKTITGMFTSVSKTFSAISQGVGTAGRVMGGLSKAFSVAFKAFSLVGRLVAWPVTVITGMIAGIMGFFTDFNKSQEDGDGILKSLFLGFAGFHKGVVNAIIMKPLDLLKDGVAWIAGKLGFENFEKMLSEFSFEQTFTSLVDGFTGMVTGAFEWIIDAITNFDVGAALGSALDWGHEMMMNLKGIIAGVLPDVDSWAGKLIPDAVYEYLDQSPPPPVKEQETPAGTTESEVPSQEDLQSEFDADQAELTRVQKDYDEGNASEIDLEAAKAFAKMSEMALKGAEQETTGTGKPVVEEQPIEQTEPAQEPVAVEKFEVPEKEATPKEMNEATADFLKKLDDPQWQKEAAEKRRKREEDFAKMQEKATADRQRREAEHLAAKEKSNQKLLDNEELLRTMKETGMRDGKELSERDMMYLDSKIRRIDTLKQSRGADVDSMSRENARQGEKSVTVVAPSSQNVTTNNNQSTAAIMTQNQPTVDQNDRSYGVV